MLPTSVKVQDPLLNKSYTGKNITHLLLPVLLRLCSTSNNANCNKQVIFFWYIWYKPSWISWASLWFWDLCNLVTFMRSFTVWREPRNIVSSPDLIQRVYHLQYNTRDTESDPRWGWFWVWDRDYKEQGNHNQLKCYKQETNKESEGSGGGEVFFLLNLNKP